VNYNDSMRMGSVHKVIFQRNQGMSGPAVFPLVDAASFGSVAVQQKWKKKWKLEKGSGRGCMTAVSGESKEVQ